MQNSLVQPYAADASAAIAQRFTTTGLASGALGFFASQEGANLLASLASTVGIVSACIGIVWACYAGWHRRKEHLHRMRKAQIEEAILLERLEIIRMGRAPAEESEAAA